MPWIVPSHTAPALLLKTWKPAVFSGLGLVLGTVAPDLAFMLRLDNDAVLAHTFLGQVYITVPLVLFFHAVTARLVLPWLLPLVPGGTPLHLHALAAVRPATTTRDWARVAFSGWVGGLTHILLDGFTHGNHTGWALPYLPVLSARVPFLMGTVPLHDALHAGASLLLGILSLVLWAHLAEKGHLFAWRDEDPRVVAAAPADERRREITWLAGYAALGMLIAPALRPGASPAVGMELALFGGIAFTIYGAVIGALRALAGARRRLRAARAS
jgi:Domain of unknown function (DUF4184)